jgi:hypothetical protein
MTTPCVKNYFWKNFGILNPPRQCYHPRPMALAYMPGSAAHKHLKRIARLLGGAVATDFYGVTVAGRRILYRHGLAWTQHSARKQEYDQIVWQRPFGRAADQRKVDFVLLHAAKPRELFFLFAASKAAALAMNFPARLNIAADPAHVRGIREKIWAAQVSLAELKRKLRA